MRIWMIAVSLSVCASVWSQGGGFGGGGAAGAAGGTVPMTGDEATFTQILTPGDKGEWTLDVTDGETIIASAKSNLFDAALEVVDEQNKVLASNDDIEPGNQTARLLYRFAKAGKYRVWVKGFKSAAGGQFTFTMRRFVPIDAPVGLKSSLILDKTGTAWTRFTGQKGKPMSLYTRGAVVSPSVEVFDSTGEVVNDTYSGSDDKRVDIRTIKDGDYFARITSRNAAKASVEFRPTLIPVRQLAVGSSISGAIPTEGVEIVMVPLKQGDLVLVAIESKGPKAWASSGSMEESSSHPDLAQVFYHMDKGRWETLLARKDAILAVTVGQPGELATDYKLSVTKIERTLANGTVQASVPVGGVDFYTFQAKQGELVELRAKSPSLDPQLFLFDPEGRRLLSNDDSGDSMDSSITALLPADGKYTLAFTSAGMGGSGSYELSRKAIAPAVISIGESKAGTIVAGNPQVWTFQARAGQKILLSLSSSSANVEAKASGPNGEEIGSTNEDNVAVLKISADGVYSIWVTASEGGGNYRIKLIDIDS